MSDLFEQLSAELQDLRRVRDELKVQSHLAKAEAKELWEELEQKWPEVERNVKQFEQHSAEAIDELAKATRGLIAHMKQSYRRFTR